MAVGFTVYCETRYTLSNDVTFTDLKGNEYSLYSILDAGKVILDISSYNG